MLNSIMQFVIRTILIFGLSFSVGASGSADYPTEIKSVKSNVVPLPDATHYSRSSTRSSTHGASLKQIFGMVLINHGKGYSIARLDMALKSGDRVMTMDGAQAVVVQDDGCVTKLHANSILTLPLNASACQHGNNSANKSIKKIGPYYARAIGSEAVTDVSPSVSEEALEKSPLNTTPPASDTQVPDTSDGPPIDTPTLDTTTASAEAAETVEQSVGVVEEAEGGSFFNNLSTTQIVVTGVAVGLGLAVAGGGGGGGAVSAE